MKNSLSKFQENSFSRLSEEEMKKVAGGWLYWSCRGGMTGQGDHYESWMCDGAGGLSYIIAEI